MTRTLVTGRWIEMNSHLTPMRWPAAWRDPVAFRLLADSGIGCLLNAEGPIADEARRAGIEIAGPTQARIIEGEWPGIRASAKGGDHVDAGPTGEPWVDSNGWKLRLEAALHPGVPVWVDAKPASGSFALAIADAAAHGGRWIVTLPDDLAAAIGRGDARALQTWKALTSATAFFAAHGDWSSYTPQAVIGIVSDFTGPNEFLSTELLNLLARANQQYNIVVKSSASEAAWNGLRALIYPDADPPSPELRRRMLAFAEAGGLLIAGPKWGTGPGRPTGPNHPRYDVRALGKGRIAIARSEIGDPYEMANDSVVLVSHRYELLRFWNTGAVGSLLTASPDRGRILAHLLFYADQGPADAAVRIAGHYRAATLRTLDRADPRRPEVLPVKDGVEVHLPRVNHYAALELEV